MDFALQFQVVGVKSCCDKLHQNAMVADTRNWICLFQLEMIGSYSFCNKIKTLALSLFDKPN